MTEAAFIDAPDKELAQRACDILNQARGKPRDIAWAWMFLCALERGELFPLEEKTYRRIHDAREWIIAQGFAMTDKEGMPTKLSKGVAVGEIPKEGAAYEFADIEDRMMIRLSEVAVKAKAQGLAWVENGGIQINTPKAVQKGATQENAILQIIADNGLDPLNLPPFRRGANGKSSKKLIRTEALKNKSLFTTKSFEHAWERLAGEGKIIHPEALKDSP